jgi:hypothetical protein
MSMKNRRNIFEILFLLIFVFLPAMSSADSRMPPPDFPLLEAIKKDDLQKEKAILTDTPSTVSR